ncbi:hypothetical protein [Tumidithrix helvetica]|uniref:hypothetical protein n=1 Tax=Tumidithrix helvetica TaxID=3457545 RepID=UPI003CC5347D
MLTNFYQEECDIALNPWLIEEIGKTSHERFFSILLISPSARKAKIIRGVLKRFPPDAPSQPKTRTKELYDELLSIAERLEGSSPR